GHEPCRSSCRFSLPSLACFPALWPQ
ncbi:Stage V sporulation protein SpoVM, partial [Dysosmobacter welbionis]